MKFRYLLVIFSILWVPKLASAQNPKIEKGILDLRYTGVPEGFISLDGEWEFFWEQHLLPADLKNNSNISPDLFMDIPSYWSEYSDKIPGITQTGYASYRLRILIPESNRDEFLFSVPIFDSSYRIYFDGKYVNANGVPGTSLETTKADYKPFDYKLKPQGDTIEIIINVSNFHHRRGGFWLPMRFGKVKIAEYEIKRDQIFTSLTNGMLFAFFIFYLIFFLVFRDDRTMLYFALASLSILIRTLFTGAYDILWFFDVSWRWLIRIEYLSSFMALGFSLWYFYYIFRDRFMPWINTALTVLVIVGSLITLVTPVSIFSYTMLFFMPLIMVVLGYYLIRSIIAAYKEGGYKTIVAFGFGILLLGVTNDVLVASGRSFLFSEYILSHALIFFILMQVVGLIYRWVEAGKKEKKLHDEIEFVNKNLENIVIERTTELTNQKGEIEEQKKLADRKNTELEKTISVKNRIFSIIAHDLKSPVLNLSLMIDHLKDNKDPEAQKSVINSITQQAGFASNLIENLLIWGEQQQNKIEYKPEHINLTDLVLENFNLLSEPSERKGVKMTYSHKGNPTAICDRDLINIVLRNLLSNAIKFTSKNGSVYVSVEEPVIRDGMIYIKIKDNGVGIPGDKLEKILGDEIVDSTRGTDDEKGTGLGLQLCNDLIRINKGSLTIESEVDRGTTIKIMLPSPTKS